MVGRFYSSISHSRTFLCVILGFIYRVIENINSGIWYSYLCYLVTLEKPSVSFIICRTGIIVVPTSYEFYEDYMRQCVVSTKSNTC